MDNRADIFRRTFATAPAFHGATIVPERDVPRLARQLERVRDLMLDSEKRTLEEIAVTLGAPEASVSARLRDLRRPRHGGFTVTRHYLGNGLHSYSVHRPLP